MHEWTIKIDNIKNYTASGDWICGRFLEDALLKTDVVEEKVSTMQSGFTEPEHIHPVEVVVVIILEGDVSYKVDGKITRFTDGDFVYVKNPVKEVVVEVYKPTRCIVIRTPSVEGNKEYV